MCSDPPISNKELNGKIDRLSKGGEGEEEASANGSGLQEFTSTTSSPKWLLWPL